MKNHYLSELLKFWHNFLDIFLSNLQTSFLIVTTVCFRFRILLTIRSRIFLSFRLCRALICFRFCVLTIRFRVFIVLIRKILIQNRERLYNTHKKQNNKRWLVTGKLLIKKSHIRGKNAAVKNQQRNLYISSKCSYQPLLVEVSAWTNIRFLIGPSYVSLVITLITKE